VLFIGLFFVLLFNTAFRGTFSANSDTPVRLPWPVEGFLLTDPFVALMTLLSTHAVYRGLAWSLVIVGLTLTFGRVFCGWICPFGTLHHFFAWIFPSRYVRGKQRVVANHTKGWQLAKYYLMLGFLASAVVGSAIGGLFDPICIAVRAIGLGVLPGSSTSESARGPLLPTRTSERFRRRPTPPRISYLAPSGRRASSIFIRRGSSRSCSSRPCS